MGKREGSELKEQLRGEWAAIADTWIDVTSSGRNEYREGLLDSWMLDAVGEVSGRHVVDLGCGEGRFSRMMAERGARVTGVDLCRRFIEYASAHRVADEDYVEGDMEDLGGVADGRSDLALSYVSLVDVPDFRNVVKEAYRVLRPGGRFIVCNLQPMTTAANGWIKFGKEKLHFKLDDYFDEGVRAMPIHGHELTNFHRTLSSYLNSFLDAGFMLEGIREPKPSPQQIAQYPGVADNLRVPYFIIYLLRKPRRSSHSGRVR